MGFGAFRGIIRNLPRTLASRSTPSSLLNPQLKPEFRFPLGIQSPWTPKPKHFSFLSESGGYNSLTDTRFPKRRPVDKPRRKRAALRPPGPYAWVKYVPGQPIQPNNPNEGSVKRRNEKKRIRLRLAFMKAEAKKRKAQLQEAKRKKKIKRVERKMAAAAREREWAVKLAELQKLEEEKKRAMA